ncbi:MAG: hypothetical protein WBQ94_04280 [Terracidiphilus sp.]
MGILVMILMVLAVVLLFLAAAGVNHPRYQFGWLGMALWALVVLIGAVSGSGVTFHHNGP